MLYVLRIQDGFTVNCSSFGCIYPFLWNKEFGALLHRPQHCANQMLLSLMLPEMCSMISMIICDIVTLAGVNVNHFYDTTCAQFKRFVINASS